MKYVDRKSMNKKQKREMDSKKRIVSTQCPHVAHKSKKDYDRQKIKMQDKKDNYNA